MGGKKMFFGGKQKPMLIFTINTALGASANFKVTTQSGSSYDIDWGDGSSKSVGQSEDSVLHDYASNGIYQIKISGKFVGFNFNNNIHARKLTSVDQWGDVSWGVIQTNAFYGCYNLEVLAEDASYFNNIIDAAVMFRGCNKLIIPTAINFESLLNGNTMFAYITSVISFPSTINFKNINNGGAIFYRTTISTVSYSNLLINLEANNANTAVTFDGGYSKYNSSASSARANLITRGWTIYDLGLE